MSNTDQREGEDVSQKYDWRTYQTPTKTTAHVLEDLVGDGSPKSQGSNTSSTSTGSFVVLEPNTQPIENRPPLTPLPLYPPTYNAEKSQEPSPPQLPPRTSLSDVTENSSKSSKYHKSRESFTSSIPPRVADDFRRSERRTSPSGTTKTASTTTTTGTSPTDSHPGRHHPHTHTRGHARSRSSSESLSSLLLVTTERLSRETSRANEAERKSSEIMSLFKNTFEAKTKLERELIRTRQELEMYKIQLDVAQKEIFRAQEVVERVDKERATAQEEAARARDKIHKLKEVRAVELAMEEGRRMGFEDGLRQGRYVQPVREASHEAPRSRRSRDQNDLSRYTYTEQNGNRSGSSDESRRHRRTSSRPPQTSVPERPTSKVPPPRPDAVQMAQPLPGPPPTAPTVLPPPPPPPPVHRHGTPPDVGSFENLLPRPTITTPMPVLVPSTQPQPPPPMPPHQAPTTLHDHSSHPEKITVQPLSNDPNGPIHPIPVWNHSPSVMHERIVLPPDNYIPTMDANSMISLPPPHELSRPVPAEAPPIKNGVPDYSSQKPRSQSRGPEKRRSLKLVDHEERETAKANLKDYYYSPKAPYRDRERERERDDASSFNYSTFSGPTAGTDKFSRKYATMPRSRAPSAGGGGVLSPASTRLSDLDLLSPPPDDSMMREGRYDSNRYENPVYRMHSNLDTPSPTQRMAQEWRNANPEFVTPPNQNFDPPAFAPARPPSASAAYTMSRPPSRRPREIVMPAPLADVFMNTTRSPRAPDHQQIFEGITPPDPTKILSTHTVPGIEVVTPSTHASSRISVGTVVDPVLLTPDSANRPHPLPVSDQGPGPAERISIVQRDDGNGNGYSTYSDNFVPLSPISGMTNLKPYPPGFAPSLPKDHEATRMAQDFKYPSSPLMR